jgi:hypothetical protein
MSTLALLKTGKIVTFAKTLHLFYLSITTQTKEFHDLMISHFNFLWQIILLLCTVKHHENSFSRVCYQPISKRLLKF